MEMLPREAEGCVLRLRGSGVTTEGWGESG